ncbi:hypothetical protein F4825DRAFT_450479 [Nemania diffusa]|nr:hypothetical protein F4825DRAFT_450479 [Nemania diffusa]
MPGWGKSTSRRVTADYTQEALVEGMLALLSANSRSAAHPAAVQALVPLCIPYKPAELGLDHLVSLVDRTIYLEDEYPFGQWDYMAYYEEIFEKCVAEFEANIPALCKIMFAPLQGYSTGNAFKPAFTASIRKSNGLFGGIPAPPAEALPDPMLEEEVFNAFVKATEEMGLWPGSAVYFNHKVNAAYSSQAPNGGRFGREKPVLYIHARFDFICITLIKFAVSNHY